jgi:type II secretory pathway pseudopilin PulG
MTRFVGPTIGRRQDPRGLTGSGENGDTLIEVLLAIVIIAIAVTAVLGGLVTSITSSAEQRSLAANDTLTKSFAETAKDQIEQMGGFHDCTNPCDSDLYQATAPTWNSASTFPTGYVQYAHYNVGISAVQCIDTATPGHACTVEELTITSKAPNGIDDRLQMIVRKAGDGPP